MAKTTIQKVKLTAVSLSALSDEAIELYIDDAYLTVQASKFPEMYEEVANRYLTAHLASVNTKNVIAEQVGTLKRQYSDKNLEDKDLNSTVYGQEYLRLKKEYVRKKGGLSLVVF